MLLSRDGGGGRSELRGAARGVPAEGGAVGGPRLPGDAGLRLLPPDTAIHLRVEATQRECHLNAGNLTLAPHPGQPSRSLLCPQEFTAEPVFISSDCQIVPGKLGKMESNDLDRDRAGVDLN